MKNPYSIGSKIYLRHPTLEDASNRWYEWFSDEEITEYLGDRYWPNTIENQVRFYQSIENQRDRLVLSIIDIESDKHIGVCGLSSISWRNHYADISIVIGEKEFRNGQPILDAWTLLLKIAFLRLNLRVIKSFYLETNLASKTIHELFRFEICGKIDNLIYHNGKYTGLMIAALHRDNWLKRNIN